MLVNSFHYVIVAVLIDPDWISLSCMGLHPTTHLSTRKGVKAKEVLKLRNENLTMELYNTDKPLPYITEVDM